MSAARYVKLVALVLGALALVILALVVIVAWPWLRRPSEYRFPLASETELTGLTEQCAVDLTRRALVADGKWSPKMRPIPCSTESRSADGGYPYFAADRDNIARGYVRWTAGDGIYAVAIEKKADQAICRVYKEK